MSAEPREALAGPLSEPVPSEPPPATAPALAAWMERLWRSARALERRERLLAAAAEELRRRVEALEAHPEGP